MMLCSPVSELWDGASQGLKCALGVGNIIRRNSPTENHFAAIRTTQSGLLVVLYHFVLEPLGLHVSHLFPTHDLLSRGWRGERRVLGLGEETRKSFLLVCPTPPS